MPPRASQSKRRGRPARDDEDEDDDENVPEPVQDSDDEDERPPRRGRASQSQTQSQSQRKRRQTPEDDDDENGDDGDESGSTETKAYALVRLALAAEYKRASLKRDDINKKALKGDSRSFKEVLERAQAILRKTFGFELHELVTRQERDRILSGKDADDDAADKKKAASNTAKQYVLRSALDPQLVAAASVVDRELAALEAAERAEDEQFGVAHDDADRAPDGSVLALADRDPLGAHALGVLHVVLALILVSGRIINEQALRALLKKLRVTPNSHIPLPMTATAQSVTLDNWLAAMVRQGYLDRQVSQLGVPTQGKRGRARTRIAANDEDSNEVVELRWGERAHAEMSEKAAARWVVDFMFDDAAEEDDEDEDEELSAKERRERDKRRAAAKEKRGKAMEGMLRDINRAAGGLVDD